MPKFDAEAHLNKVNLEKILGVDPGIIINAWKKGKEDDEIASALDLPLWKLEHLRLEIQQSHNKARNKRKSQ